MLRKVLPCFLLFALLVPTLDAQSLWWDEGISLHLATSSWAAVVSDRAANIHPPLYFFVLKVWVGLVGQTPFAARYLSALGATLLPAAVYAFVSRRFSRRTGRAAALLVALAPPFCIYGQEVRAYIFLPLLSLALLAQVWPARRRSGVLLRGSWAAVSLALTQVTFVLVHYAGIIAVAWANLALLVWCVRSRDRRAWRTWLLTAGLTGLFAAPWAWAVVCTGAVGLRGQAGLSNVLAEPAPVDYFLRLIGVFHAVGLPEALADPMLCRSVALVGALILAALLTSFVMRVLRSVPSAPFLKLLAAWLLPLTAAPVIWALSPQSHPRYLLPFVLGGWLLGSALVVDRVVPRLLRGALLAAVLAVCISGLRAYLTNPGYARSDVRAAAALIRAEAGPGDIVLAPNTDWSLLQYDLGAARPVMMPPPADDAGVSALLVREVQPGQRVFALDYGRDALDPRQEARAALEWGGFLVGRRDFHGVFLQWFDLPDAPRFPACAPSPPACIDGAGPCLVGTAIQPHPESGAALPVALCWDGGKGDARYAVALRLYAPDGALVAGADDLLVDAGLCPTEVWSGRPVTTYHLIPLPVGLLPRSYRLEGGVYAVADPNAPLSLVRQGRPPAPALVLGDAIPAVQPWLEPSPYGLPGGPMEPQVELAAGLRLEGAAVDRSEVYPGQTVFVMLRWRATSALPEVLPRLVLNQGERALTEAPLLASLPAMPAARPLLEHAALTVPPEAEDGPAHVVLAVGERQLLLGEVTLRGGRHTFIAPSVEHPLASRASDVATLLGFDWAPGPTVRAGEPVTLTLVWRAAPGAESKDLTVFVHLLGTDGGIAAQHDGKPVEGTRPTGGWAPGEILVDRHVLVWQREYAGDAVLRVGLYDAATGLRVLWDDGQDFYELPLPLKSQGS